MREVTIYCGPGWERWSPLDIESRGLGGSETAAVRVAEKLSGVHGCQVTVYGEVEADDVRGVTYRHHGAFDADERRDLLICSRTSDLFYSDVNAHRKLLWLHDADHSPVLTEQRAAHVDSVMVLSRWHRAYVAAKYPFLTDKLYVTRNGIEPSYFAGPPDAQRNPHQACYTSAPDRGLDLLLHWWPEVRRRVPDAQLVYCHARWTDRVAEWVPPADSSPAAPPDKDAFVDAIVKAMTDAGPEHVASRRALDMTWDQVAADMLAAAHTE